MLNREKLARLPCLAPAAAQCDQQQGWGAGDSGGQRHEGLSQQHAQAQNKQGLWAQGPIEYQEVPGVGSSTRGQALMLEQKVLGEKMRPPCPQAGLPSTLHALPPRVDGINPPAAAAAAAAAAPNSHVRLFQGKWCLISTNGIWSMGK